MALGQHKRAVGVFPNRQDVEQALHELRDSGFLMDRVSVVARDAGQNDDIAGADVSSRAGGKGNKADEGAVAGALTGGALGGIAGLLVGLGALAIPGIGPVMLAGATATAIATTLSGGAIGAAAGSLVGALVGLGIPEERARVYNERVSRGEYLVIVDGTDDEIRHAEAILNRQGIQEFGIYDRPDVAPARTDVTMTAPSVSPLPVATTTSQELPSMTPVPSATTTSSPVSTGIVGRKAHAVGYFSQRGDVEQAINDLGSAGYLLSLVSLIAPQFERRDYFTGVNLYGRFNDMRSGFSEEQARSYNERVSRGAYVLVVSGTEDEVNRAASILSHRGIQELQTYSLTTSGSTTEPARSDTSVTIRQDAPSVRTAHMGEDPNRQSDPITNTQSVASTTDRQIVNPMDLQPEVNLLDRRDPTL